MKLGFIGGGNMAAAMIGGLLKRGFVAKDINVAEPQSERRAWLTHEFGVHVEESAAQVLQADVIVLSVKPQQMQDVLSQLPSLRPQQLVLSIAAGVRAADISRWMQGHAAIVRAMPNTPALVGQGATGLYAQDAVTAEQRTWADEIMAAVGTVVWVEREAMIDAVTAISGSGPAYVFYFIEALEAAGIALGLSPETSRQLTVQTFLGAATLATQDTASPAELRTRVTSKGGTTERGVMALEEADIKQAIARAAHAAAARAAEMGDLFGVRIHSDEGKSC